MTPTVIYRYAGRDASAMYNSIHAPSIIENDLDSSKRIGNFDATSVPPNSDILKEPQAASPSPARPKGVRRPLQSIINTHDFEQAASENLSEKAWAFYSSAATDCVTKEANAKFFERIWLRPRILTNVRNIDTRTKMLGTDIPLPLFVSPAAMVKLAHPDGELAIGRGCSNFGIPQTVSHPSILGKCPLESPHLLTMVAQISTNASFPLGEITAAADIPYFFQLYVNPDRAASLKLVRQAEKAGVRAIFITVDQPTPGKREADERVKADAAAMAPTPNGAVAANDAKGSGMGRTMSRNIDSATSWDIIKWIRGITKLPIVLKGVQTVEDAILAVEHGVNGLLIGNHGGRSLDTSSPSILVLLELHRTCPEIFNHIEVYLDGGIRRGTDIFKALCLGAKAVGMGRQFLYAANYGPEGVEHLIESKYLLWNVLVRTTDNTCLDSHEGRIRDDDAYDGVHRFVAASPCLVEHGRCGSHGPEEARSTGYSTRQAPRKAMSIGSRQTGWNAFYAAQRYSKMSECQRVVSFVDKLRLRVMWWVHPQERTGLQDKMSDFS